MRDRGIDSAGLTIGAVNSAWNRYVAPATDESAPRALMFGGYRWRNDIAVEASFNSSDLYALRPADGIAGPRGVGLNFGSVAGSRRAAVANLERRRLYELERSSGRSRFMDGWAMPNPNRCLRSASYRPCPPRRGDFAMESITASAFATT